MHSQKSSFLQTYHLQSSALPSRKGSPELIGSTTSFSKNSIDVPQHHLSDLKPPSARKSKSRITSKRPNLLHLGSGFSYESPKVLLSGVNSPENKMVRDQYIYTSPDLHYKEKGMNRNSPMQKFQAAYLNTTDQSGKTDKSIQYPGSKSTATYSTPILSKKSSLGTRLQKELFVGLQSPSYKEVPKQVNFSQTKSDWESKNTSGTFYDNMKSYIMNLQKGSNKNAGPSQLRRNPQDEIFGKSGNNLLGFQIKGTSGYKPLRVRCSPTRKENPVDIREEEIQNILMRQTFLKNLLQVNTQAAASAEEKKVAAGVGMGMAIGDSPMNLKQNTTVGPLKMRIGTQAGPRVKNPVSKRQTTPQASHGGGSLLFNPLRNQNTVLDSAEGTEKTESKRTEKRVTNSQTTSPDGSLFLSPPRDIIMEHDDHQSPKFTISFSAHKALRELRRKEKSSKEFVPTIKEISIENSKNEAKSSNSVNKLSVRRTPQRQEPKKSKRQVSYEKKNNRAVLSRETREGAKLEEKSMNGSFTLPGHPESLLEKELMIQQGRKDLIEGWDPECSSRGYDIQVDKLENKNFGLFRNKGKAHM